MIILNCYALQVCKTRIEEYKRLSLKELKSRLVQFKKDEVTLSVCNSGGWEITFDQNPPTVFFVGDSYRIFLLGWEVN